MRATTRRLSYCGHRSGWLCVLDTDTAWQARAPAGRAAAVAVAGAPGQAKTRDPCLRSLYPEQRPQRPLPLPPKLRESWGPQAKGSGRGQSLRRKPDLQNQRKGMQGSQGRDRSGPKGTTSSHDKLPHLPAAARRRVPPEPLTQASQTRAPSSSRPEIPPRRLPGPTHLPALPSSPPPTHRLHFLLQGPALRFRPGRLPCSFGLNPRGPPRTGSLPLPTGGGPGARHPDSRRAQPAGRGFCGRRPRPAARLAATGALWRPGRRPPCPAGPRWS